MPIHEGARQSSTTLGLEVSREARIRLTAQDLQWADLIFAMEKNHRDRIVKDFRDALAGKSIICLFIEDRYEPMEESLIAILR